MEHLKFLPTLTVLGWGHRDMKIAAWTFTDHAVPDGTFCCHPSQRQCLKSVMILGVFHIDQSHLAPVPLSPEDGGKVCLNP